MSEISPSKETAPPIQIVMMPPQTAEETTTKASSIDLCLACQRCAMCACKLTDCCCYICLIIIAICICFFVIFMNQCKKHGMIDCFDKPFF